MTPLRRLLLPTAAACLLALGAPARAQPAPTPATSPPTGEAAAPAPPAAPPVAPHGLYPLWEGTGRLLGHRQLYLGTSQVALGLLGRLEVGARPLSFLFRAPNAHVRVRLLERATLALAARAEALVLLPGASEAFTSSNFVSRLDNRHVRLALLPLSLAATWQAAPWLHLHATTTLMPLLDGGGAFRHRTLGGLSLVAEALALRRHALLVHGAEVGAWAHDFWLLGLSYRYRLGWAEGRLGYFYRFTRDGVQAGPLLALGAYL